MRAHAIAAAIALTSSASPAVADDEPPQPSPPSETPDPITEPVLAPPTGVAPRQDAPPAPPPPRPPPAAASSTPAPPAREGLQLGFRTGIAFPLGYFRQADPGGVAQSVVLAREGQSETYGPQFPLILEAGFRAAPDLYFGLYGGIVPGRVAEGVLRQCHLQRWSCATFGYRVGLELRYGFAPAAAVAPWVGFGIGLTWMSGGDDNIRIRYHGVELARLIAGFDYRISRTFGVGPYLDFSIGRYSSGSVEARGVVSDFEIDRAALHYWFGVGPRFVLFP